MLEGKNLPVVRAGTQKTTVENHFLRKTFTSVKESVNSAKAMLTVLDRARGMLTWDALTGCLLLENGRINCQFEPIDADGFEMIGGDNLTQ